MEKGLRINSQPQDGEMDFEMCTPTLEGTDSSRRESENGHISVLETEKVRKG